MSMSTGEARLKMHAQAARETLHTSLLMPLCNVWLWFGSADRLTTEDDKVTCGNCWRIMRAETRRKVSEKLEKARR